MSQLLSLFFAFAQIGLFSVGGGYAAIPLIQNQIVDHFHWLTSNDFVNLLTIAEMTPGPIAVNSATFVGLRIAGITGAIVATAGCLLPSVILVTLLGILYAKYRSMNALQTVLGTLRPTVTALIASAFLTILIGAVLRSGAFSISGVDVLSLVLFLAAFTGIRFLKVPGIPAMIACGVIYMVIGSLM